MSCSEDGERMQWVNNGTSMVFPRPSRTTFGKLIHLTSNPTVDQPTLDVQLLTLDGGNFSDTRALPLSMKEERSLKLLEMLMLKIEIFKSITREIMAFINNGTSSMPMNGRVNLARVNLTKSLVSMLKDHSMLFQK
jgi:hypothetical protein